MFELEDSHFWFVAKRYFIDSILNPYKNKISKILDLGSGTGGLTKYMNKYGNVIGIENYAYAVKLARKRGLIIKKDDINNYKLNNTFDLVTICDVLYHKNIIDESKVLKQAYGSLKKGGYLLITDSALNFLKSKHDEALMGRRRFLLSELENTLTVQGFKVIKASYIYFTIFPLILINRIILGNLSKNNNSDVEPTPYFINHLLKAILYIEAKLLKFITFPIGSSVIILAIK